MSASDDSRVRLSAEERAALDSGVDPEQLEAFLGRIPAEARQYAFNACRRDPELGVYSLIGSTDPALDALWRRVWRGGEPAV